MPHTSHAGHSGKEDRAKKNRGGDGDLDRSPESVIKLGQQLLVHTLSNAVLHDWNHFVSHLSDSPEHDTASENARK